MTLVAAILLLAAAVLLRQVGHTILYPPAAFAAAWGGALLLLALSGDTFHPIAAGTAGFYVLGGAAFALGGFAVTPLLGRMRPAARVLDPNKVGWVIDAAIVGLLLLAPMYWREIMEAVRVMAVESALYAVRHRLLLAHEGAAQDFPRLLLNGIQLSIAMALLAFAVDGRGWVWRVRRLVIFGIALTYQVFTGGRAGLFLLVAGVLGVSWMVRGRFPLRLAVPVGVLGVVAAAVVAVQLEKSGLSPEMGLEDSAPLLVRSFQVYALAGVTGFDRIVDDPESIPGTGGTFRAVKEAANRVGASYELPRLHAQYVTIGDHVDVNVYSTYFPYVTDVGSGGALVLLAIAGAFTTIVFIWASTGSVAGIVLFGIVIASVAQSVFIESFFGGVNLLAKAALVLGVITLLTRTVARPTHEERQS